MRYWKVCLKSCSADPVFRVKAPSMLSAGNGIQGYKYESVFFKIGGGIETPSLYKRNQCGWQV